ncbi:MAG TPA: hypothetical protein VFT22_29120 [Kofleriaceae bacterium]|nr:hypothetical protein [Kofleriaceae bacterium]
MSHPAGHRARAKRTACAVLLAAASLVGCTGGPPAVTALDASRANMQVAELQQGRSLLLSKCGGCHRTPMPADHRANEWPVKLDEMAGRAHLDHAQRHLLEAYLVTVATR